MSGAASPDGPAGADDAPVLARVRIPVLAWPILATAWLSLLLCNTDRYAWANASVVAGKDFALSPILAISLFSAAGQTGFLVSVGVGGLVADWIGARRVLGSTAVLLGAACYLFGTSSSMLFGMLMQFALGLSAGPIYAAGIKLISTWFGQIGRATAIGIFTTAIPLALVLTNSLVPFWLHSAGWRAAYGYLGAITAAVGLLAFLVVRDRTAVAKAASAPADSLKRLLKNRNFRWLAVANMGGPWGSIGFAIWTNTLFVQGRHLTPIQAGSIVAIYGAGAVGAKLAIGVLSDLMGGRRKLLAMLCLGAFGAGLIVFGTPHDLATLRWFAFLLGIVGFAWGPLVNTMVAESAIEISGSAAGMSLLLTAIADIPQPLLIGAVYAATGSIPLVFAIFAAGPLLSVYAISRVDASIR